MESIVWPSAGDLSTSIAPIVFTPPGLFSTMTFQPSLSDSALAMMRARISGGVEAEAGTTTRTTPEGNVWAWAKVCASAETNPVAASTVKTGNEHRNDRPRVMDVLSKMRFLTPRPRVGIVSAQTSTLIGAKTSFATATRDAGRCPIWVIRVDFGLHRMSPVGGKRKTS